MNSEAPSKTTAPEMTQLALVCLAHLEREEALLEALLTSLQQVRAALLSGELKALTLALEGQDHTARAAQEIRQSRARLREELAVRLGTTPETVTIQLLAGRLPGELGQRLASCRERLRQMTAAVDELNQGNVLLIRQSVDFLHQLLVEITGGNSSGGCYSGTGTRQDARCGSLIEAQG